MLTLTVSFYVKELAIPLWAFPALVLLCTLEQTATPLPLLGAWEGEGAAPRCYRVLLRVHGHRLELLLHGPVFRAAI